MPMMKPEEILFSLPTLCEAIPAVAGAPPPGDARFLAEDDWRQIEFVGRSNSSYIEEQLASLATFKAEHRRGPGWTKVFMRGEHPWPLETIRFHSSGLPKFPNAALAIGGGPPWGGAILGGFALTDASDWFLYGQGNEEGCVTALALSPGRSSPSEQFLAAVSQLAQAGDLLLVDWYTGSLVDTRSFESIGLWAQRYHRDYP